MCHHRADRTRTLSTKVSVPIKVETQYNTTQTVLEILCKSKPVQKMQNQQNHATFIYILIRKYNHFHKYKQMLQLSHK